uniref:Phosphofructokinase n=1 Tax=Pectobacterium phage Koroua TaxID=3158138 RepID=A0AB39ABN5_9CAUD
MCEKKCDSSGGENIDDILRDITKDISSHAMEKLRRDVEGFGEVRYGLVDRFVIIPKSSLGDGVITGKKPVHKYHVYNPKNIPLGRVISDVTPPCGAIVEIIGETKNTHGAPVVAFKWMINDPACPGVEMHVDYCRMEMLTPMKGDMRSDEDVLKHNWDRYEKEMNLREPLARSASEILCAVDNIIGERGKQYDPDSKEQERSADKIAKIFSALKGIDFTGQDVWDLMIVLKLVRSQNDNGVDSRLDLVGYAALAAELSEQLKFGSND